MLPSIRTTTFPHSGGTCFPDEPMAGGTLPFGNGAPPTALGPLGHPLGETLYVKAAESAPGAG